VNANGRGGGSSELLFKGVLTHLEAIEGLQDTRITDARLDRLNQAFNACVDGIGFSSELHLGGVCCGSLAIHLLLKCTNKRFDVVGGHQLVLQPVENQLFNLRSTHRLPV